MNDYGFMARTLCVPNRTERFAVDLTNARTVETLEKAAFYLTVLDMGTGTWSIILEHAGDSSTRTTIPSTELARGARFGPLDISDLLFTNTAQPAAAGPVFYRAYRAAEV